MLLVELSSGTYVLTATWSNVKIMMIIIIIIIVIVIRIIMRRIIIKTISIMQIKNHDGKNVINKKQTTNNRKKIITLLPLLPSNKNIKAGRYL